MKETSDIATALMEEPANDAAAGPADRPSHHRGPWITTAHHRKQIDSQWLIVMFGFVMLGSVFTGWRGLVALSVTAGAAVAIFFAFGGLIRLILKRPPIDAAAHVLTMGLLLGVTMPLMKNLAVHAVAGGFLGIVMHAFGRSHRLRVHPVAIVMLTVWLGSMTLPNGDGWYGRGALSPNQSVLAPHHLALGDVFNTTESQSNHAWFGSDEHFVTDAVRRPDTGAYLLEHLDTLVSDRSKLIAAMGSGELVRLEELFIGAVADAGGAAGRFAVIVFGFYLMYRWLMTWSNAVWPAVFYVVAMMVLPVSVPGAAGDRDWLLLLETFDHLGPAAAVTVFAYLIFATPMTLIVLIGSPMTAPMSVFGRIVYSFLVGAGGLLLMWYARSPSAAWAALAIAGLVSRPLDGLHRSRFV